MDWICKSFDELDTKELYTIIQTRIDVFVVEQQCPYHELDGHDYRAVHLFCKDGKKIVAYARLLPKGTVYEQASIGRVLVHKQYRGQGLARELLQKAIFQITEQWQETTIKIQGQEYLRHFYASFGFKEISDVYLDDDIPHVDMLFTTLPK
ncbi:GNAT family N-acetyltransferase [Sediminibacillus halophilus]|uniref:ElaA protein n=1 Tax=Sediminibacillus halophilus TaxID=482461 RepID=A0A1G9WVT7_9BACI|nr:GNAT family N-acetyltransferase [Sediminibacillus halophilus]SDM88203.1 ElaA protein [Sediminibacillus halophilus]